MGWRDSGADVLADWMRYCPVDCYETPAEAKLNPQVAECAPGTGVAKYGAHCQAAGCTAWINSWPMETWTVQRDSSFNGDEEAQLAYMSQIMDRCATTPAAKGLTPP